MTPEPLTLVLAFLPPVVAALGGIARAAVARGGRRISPRATAGELTALAVLVLLALARPRLGFDLPPEVVYAGFVVLLAERVGRQLPALRPLLGRELPERPSALFFLLPLTVYLALLPWSALHRQPDGDEPYYLLLTHSLAYDFDDDLANNYAAGDWRRFMDRPLEPQPGDPVGPDGEQYSRHNLLLPLALAPAYRVAGKWGALVVMAALTAALAWVTLRLAQAYFRRQPGAALAAWALVAFMPPLLVYSYQVWVEVPGTLLAMLALDRIRRTRGGPEWGLREWLGIAVPLLLLPLVKIRFMLLAVPLVALGWWHAGRPRKPLILLAVALGAVGGAILLHNQLVYDSPLKMHSVGELELTRYSAAAYARGAVGLFYDCAFGLFAAAPLWLILLPAAAVAIARHRALLFDLAVFALPYTVVLAPRAEWFGAWSPPFRYALVALPLLALVAVPLLARRRRGGARALLAALGGLTLLLAVLWVAVPGWTYNFADGRSDLLDLVEARTGVDVARLFPSALRPRAATWIWPLAGLAAVPLWWWPRRLRRPATWGGAALLAAGAVTLWAAARLPTRVVEFEDPWVATTGGHVHPELWVPARPAYVGGWVLTGGESARAAVVAGGSEVAVRLHLRFIENRPGRFDVELRAGDRLVHRWRVSDGTGWRWLEAPPAAWSRGDPLVVAALDRGGGGPANGVILDRAELRWR